MEHSWGSSAGSPVLPPHLDGVTLRPMREEDVPDADLLWASAYSRADGTRPDRSDVRVVAWRERTRRLVRSDGAGCWVADRDGEMLGFATSFRRELLWGLSTYAVAPAWRGRGLGRVLLQAALGHARGCLRGLLSSSADAGATRRYRSAGFDLHPQMTLSGTVDRTRLPIDGQVRDGSAGDQEWMDSLDRATRSAAHGDDHRLFRATYRLRVVDRPVSRGYAYLDADGTVALLAASDRRTASRLLWDALAHTDGPVRQAHVTAANQWALGVGIEAGLSLGTDGYLGVRGLKPPAPYLHHGALL